MDKKKLLLDIVMVFIMATFAGATIVTILFYIPYQIVQTYEKGIEITLLYFSVLIGACLTTYTFVTDNFFVKRYSKK